MDMTIQLQVLSALISQLIIYVTMRKKIPHQYIVLSRSTAPKTQQIAVTNVLSYEKVSVLVQSSIPCLDQGIIDPTGTETFARELELATILRKLKPMLVSREKKSPLIFVVFKCFKCFAVGQLANGCFFLT